MVQGLLWDVFCRVVDNFGDIGVCWRLACELASRGERVRLWTTDSTALAWMAPQGHRGLEVLAWKDAAARAQNGDVVVETFGCDLPESVLHRMAQRAPAPLWINLEYLSAEGYAVASHALPSPQWAGPAKGLTKWFYFPGFLAGTGGLIREADLAERQLRFDAAAWLAQQGLARNGDERVVSLFCYEAPAVAALLDVLASAPTLLLATAGPAARQVAAALGNTMRRGALRAVTLPHLTQLNYDHLLWASDLNIVRGEDSWVRAQWAGRPFIWQPYVQDDGAHATKLSAFLDLYLENAPKALAASVRELWLGWNGPIGSPLTLPCLPDWHRHALLGRESLLRQDDLVTRLLGFARENR